jgi:hypothetical protein
MFILWRMGLAIVTVRVDDATKKKMEKLRGVNWSEVARKAFEEKIRESEFWRPVDVARMRQAAASTDALRRRVEGRDSTAEIRKWRGRDQR